MAFRTAEVPPPVGHAQSLDAQSLTGIALNDKRPWKAEGFPCGAGQLAGLADTPGLPGHSQFFGFPVANHPLPG